MPRKIVAGNWKMHGGRSRVTTLLSELKNHPDLNTIGTELVVLPPALYIDYVEQVLEPSPIAWGAQDSAMHREGAFTGQISAEMLGEFGCKFCLVGHSERRHINQESNDTVARKLQAVIDAGLTPILCIGETAEQRQANEIVEVLSGQIDTAIQQVGVEAFQNIILAYEPVWAIGTGLAATPELANETHAICRELVAQYNKDIADDATILYGGSVKADNAKSIMEQSEINGALVGGASLDAWQFMAIASAAM